MALQYTVIDSHESYPDEDDMVLFDSAEDAESYIETHPLTEDGYTHRFRIMKRTVTDWENL